MFIILLFLRKQSSGIMRIRIKINKFLKFLLLKGSKKIDFFIAFKPKIKKWLINTF